LAIKPTIFTITDEDTGETFDIEGPADTTDEELFAAVRDYGLEEQAQGSVAAPQAPVPVSAPDQVQQPQKTEWAEDIAPNAMLGNNAEASGGDQCCWCP
jgi:hypothetical protein